MEGSTSPGNMTIDAAPTDWSVDGRYITYTQRSSTTTSDFRVLPLVGDRKAMPVVQSDVINRPGPSGRMDAG